MRSGVGNTNRSCLTASWSKLKQPLPSNFINSLAVTNQTITLGDFELTAISDGIYVADGGAFFGVVPKVLWQRKVKSDELNRIEVSCNSVLVRTGKQTVLIETGIGNKLTE